MIADNAKYGGIMDLVAENVVEFPDNPEVCRMVYLVQQFGAYKPGLYVFTPEGTWDLRSRDPVA